MADNPTPPAIIGSQAILAVADVVTAVRFYRDRVGFTNEWLWGDPPDFGGVTWGKVHLMFSLAPELARKVEGHEHAFLVTGIDRLYEQHRQNGVPIVSPPVDKPWGLREYAVRDPNGYRLRFGEPLTAHATSIARKALPETVRLIDRRPTIEEYAQLTDAVGWRKDAGELGTARAALEHSLFCVVAVDGEAVVGMARLIGDTASAFYVQDVVVHPDYQRNGIGAALMDAVMDYFQRCTPKHSAIGLFTGRHLGGFYERHGFEGPDTSLYGMYFKK